MGRTAPAPDVPPTPGMCPHVVVRAGGGAGGGSGGGGAGSGGGGSGGGPGGDGSGADAGGAGATDGSPDGEKGHASGGHPIDLVTGAMYTPPFTDFALPGPLDVAWTRCYRTTNLRRSCGIGAGWWHTYAWRAQVAVGRMVLVDGQGLATTVPALDDGAEVALPHGRRVTRRGALLLVTSTDGLQRTLAPHPCGWHLLADVRDRADNAISIEVDRAGTVQRIHDAVGRRVERTIEGSRQHWSAVAIDAEGREHRRHYVSYELDARGNLARVIDPEGHAWSYVYDDRDYMISERRPDGVRFHFVYERLRNGGHRRCIETWGELEAGDILRAIGRDTVSIVAPDGARPRGIFHTKIEHGPDPNTTVVTEGDGGVHHYFGNALGLVEKYVDPRGNVTTSSYDALGNVTSRDDGAAAHAETKTNLDGLVLTHTDELGNTTSVDRDERGFATEVHDAAGGVWQMEYDARGLQTSLRTSSGALTTLEYDARGQITRRVQPDGVSIERSYDGHGNLVREQRAGAVWQYEYDLFGCVLGLISPRGARWRLGYDRCGRNTSIDGPGGLQMRFERDALGRPVRVTHPSGGTTTTRYVADAVVERRYADGSTMRLGYDALLRGIWLENGAGEQHLVRRDPMGFPLWERTFAGIETRRHFDVANRLVRLERHDAGVVEFQYDPLGRLLEIVYADGSRDAFEYDPLGRVVSATSGQVGVSYQLDVAGQVLREEQRAADWHFVVEHERDAIGRIVRTRYSTGWGVARRFDVDDLEELQVSVNGAVVDGVTLVSDGLGRQRSRLRHNSNQRLDAEHDELGRPTALRVSDGDQTLRERSYAWSERAGLTRVEDDRSGVRKLELDVFGRISEDQGPHADQALSYSAHGTPVPADRRVELTAGGRVTSSDGNRYVPDALGRLETIESSGQQWTLRYDGRDRLVELTSSDGLRVRNLYDAFGRRLAQSKGDRTTWFGWDADAPVEENDGAGSSTRRVYDRDDFTPLLEGTTQDGWSLVVSDAVATPWLWLQHDGATRELELDALGRVVHTTTNSRLRLAGQRADDDAGLVYQRFRYYLPEVGQFISPDPLGLDASYQDVGFVPNVTAYVDPLGLVVVCMTDDPGAQWDSYNRAQATGQPWVHGRNLPPGALANESHVEIATHGAPGQAQMGSNWVSGSQMGQSLRDHWGFKGKSVTLIVCDGATPPAGGGNSFAQDVANETGANVTGANGAKVPFGSGTPGLNPHLYENDNRIPGAQHGHYKCGTWDTVGPQHNGNVTQTLPPPGPRVPPGFDPTQTKPAWTY